MALRLRRPAATCRRHPGGHAPSTSAPRPRRWRRTGRPRPSHRRLGCGALVSLGGDVADGRPGTGRRVRHRHRRHLHLAHRLRGGEHLVGRARVVGHRRAPVAPRARTRSITSWTRPPACPRRPAGARSPTTAATCVQANAASTAAIVLGERAVDWLEGLGLPARLVRLDGDVVVHVGVADPRAGVSRAGRLSTR